MATEYIIDCAGNKVPVGDKLFSVKCWVGNSTDYLETNDNFIIPEASSWLDIPKISIVLPIYRAGNSFLPTLNSICSQDWPNPTKVEIILYVNQPLGAIDDLTQQSIDAAKAYIASDSSAANSPSVRLIFEQLPGGLAEVYQRSFSTLASRIKCSVDTLGLETKDENAAAIGALMDSTVFAIIDDDQVLSDTSALPQAVKKLTAGKSVIMGQVDITAVETSYTQWNPILTGVMNLFFAFKYEHGTVILTPRALMVSDLFHMPAVKIGNEYADQIWFATASAKKERFMIDVTTTLVEEDYPSNANMVTCIASYLETGKNPESINIFKNLRTSYEKNDEDLVYSLEDLNSLIEVLESRDKNAIGPLVTQLINKQQK